MLQGVLTTGRPTWATNKLLPMMRNGFLEVRTHSGTWLGAVTYTRLLVACACACEMPHTQEVYLTWSFSAVCDDLGVPRGVMTISFETSAEVISSRQIQYSCSCGPL
jgi:hypothetical protein